MFENVDIHSSIAVYAQIENQVQFGIASGRLKAGDRLPSIREVSEKLDLNPNTVAKAYRDLQVMGLVWTRRGMGVFVAKGAEAKCRDQSRRQILDRVREVAAEAKAAGMTLKEVQAAIEKSYASDAGLYAPAPRGLAVIGRGKKRTK